MQSTQGENSFTRPHVAIASLGGTITMARRERDGGLVSTLTAGDLLETVPAIVDVAEVSAVALLTQPSASMDFDDVISALTWARKQVTEGSAGVVLLQGTDTMEESSYLMDLYWDCEEPLVFTGAMRAADHHGSDGPANLLSATIVTADPQSRSRGVLVVMNEQIHAANRVCKSDSIAVEAFSSGTFGPLGRFREGQAVFANKRRRQKPLPLPDRPSPDRPSPDVVLIETTLADSGVLLHAALRGGASGVVISAFGAGHVSAKTASLISDVLAEIPVVIATRTGSGSVLSDTYAFAGSERDLLHRGVISAGWLAPRKARLLLWAALSAGFTREEIRTLFDQHGNVV